jgi:hypothetical protein
MARISRPPGFDMTYRPKQSVAFGPPLHTRIPSMAYLAVAVGLVVFVIVGSLSASGTWMFRYVVEQDDSRILGARALVAIVLVSAFASVIRSRMRGVVVHPEGLETRDILGLGWPRVRHYAWPQIDKIALDAGGSIALLLWDGTRELLPAVRAKADLADMLERIALARAIPVTGARGAIDVEPDLED